MGKKTVCFTIIGIVMIGVLMIPKLFSITPSENIPETTKTETHLEYPEHVPENAAILAPRHSSYPLLLWRHKSYAPVLCDNSNIVLSDQIEIDCYAKASDGKTVFPDPSDFELYHLKGWEDNSAFIAIKSDNFLFMYKDRDIMYTIPMYGTLKGSLNCDSPLYDTKYNTAYILLKNVIAVDGEVLPESLEVVLSSEEDISLFEQFQRGDMLQLQYCGSDGGEFDGLNYVYTQSPSCVYFMNF